MNLIRWNIAVSPNTDQSVRMYLASQGRKGEAPEFERCILWNDAELAIDWKLGDAMPLLSAKDQAGKALREAEIFL